MTPMTLWERIVLWVGLRLGWYETVTLTPDADGVITIPAEDSRP